MRGMILLALGFGLIATASLAGALAGVDQCVPDDTGACAKAGVFAAEDGSQCLVAGAFVGEDGAELDLCGIPVPA